MVDDSASKKGPGAGVQAIGAVVLAVGVVGTVWGLSKVLPDHSDDPATCSNDRPTQTARHVSGAQLCEALNRPDLAALLGTPDEHAIGANGNRTWSNPADGSKEAKQATAEANVQLKTYSVKLSASFDADGVAGMRRFLGTGANAHAETLRGHSAVLYSDRTIAFSFDGGKAHTGTGGIARHLLVASAPKDGGDLFELVIWRQDDVPPDDAALTRVAERVLPTLPGWHDS
ncbi:DUF6215 domain-containing protein [Streptomyces sp. NPDC086787]|uniref:DUF6215 domain-containing protein n=1 Tax=Streptomyces sp. NPDC086787 TaxID=3365759 RepID=UPI00380CEF17